MSVSKVLNYRFIFIRSIYVKNCADFKNSSSKNIQPLNEKPPDPPSAGLCCMSGCANCVWIMHAEELIKFYKKSGDAKKKILELIDKEVEDESLKAYLKFEISLMTN